MLNTYITNQGMTQTIVHKPNRNYVNQTNWDANYDGDVANISLRTNMDGDTQTMNIQLDNNDLANLLNVQTVNRPIHERLQMDFEQPQEPLYIELPAPQAISPIETLLSSRPEMLMSSRPEVTMSSRPEVTTSSRPEIAMSSPRTNEELIIPMTIDRKTADRYTRTSRRGHKRKKTHISHRVYKKRRTSASSRRKHSSTRRHRSMR
ncbi:MAG: hypothetical protein ACOVRN_14795 [Flavobacterium sp.]